MNIGTIISSLKEVESYSKGEIQLKTTIITPPLIDVKRLRDSLGLSQREFAERYGFPSTTIENWEQGLSEPEGPARVLLTMIEQNPTLVENEIKKPETDQ